MIKRVLTLSGVLLLFGVFPTLVYAHICHSVFRMPGLVVVRPEKDVTTIGKSDRFSVYVQNNYQAPVTKVRLIAKATDPDAKVTVAPAAIAGLRPGQRERFTVDVSVGGDGAGGARQRDFAIRFSIDTREFRVQPVKKPTDAALRKILRGGGLSGQLMVAEELSRRGDKEMTEFLKRAVSVKRARLMRASYPLDNARRAARYLGRMGREEFAPFLRKRLVAELTEVRTGNKGGRMHHDETDDPARHRALMRGNIIIGLGLLGLKEDVALFEKAAAEEKGFVRASALLALAIRRDKKAQAKLKGGLEDADEWVRLASAWGRAVVKDPVAIAMLRRIADERHDNEHRSRAMSAERAFAGDALVHLAALEQ